LGNPKLVDVVDVVPIRPSTVYYAEAATKNKTAHKIKTL